MQALMDCTVTLRSARNKIGMKAVVAQMRKMYPNLVKEPIKKA